MLSHLSRQLEFVLSIMRKNLPQAPCGRQCTSHKPILGLVWPRSLPAFVEEVVVDSRVLYRRHLVVHAVACHGTEPSCGIWTQVEKNDFDDMGTMPPLP